MTMILMVCTANICRSPVAEALLRERLRTAGLSAWRVVSGGFLEDGYRAASLGLEVLAERHGLDLGTHRSRRLTSAVVDRADLVLCMEQRHVKAVSDLVPEGKGKVFLLAEMTGEAHDVEDPYGGPRTGYERMVREVDDLLARGLARIVELAQSP